MKETIIVEIDENNIDEKKLQGCAQIIREGGTVAFPTETVYGLGANALDSQAVKKIFEAKGRPSDNPLIVHVAKAEDILPLVKAVPDKAKTLMEAFWPGPLTIILEKSDIVPNEISAGLSTVALRLPSHAIGRKLIELAGVPVAAPSANLSGKPSPTSPDHVIEDLRGRIDGIIAGGKADVGVESTVIDMTGELPMILRPGGVTKEMLEAVLGRVEVDPALEKSVGEDVVPKAPGMKYTHYAPKAQVVLVQGNIEEMVHKVQELVMEHEKKGQRVGVIATDETLEEYKAHLVKSIGSRNELKTIAANLFRVLREFDETNVDIIIAETVEEKELGKAIMNRLMKAAGYYIVKV